MRAGLLVLLFCAGSCPADWLRLTSPHFELLTDVKEKDGRKVLERLETVRHVFLESVGGKAPSWRVQAFQFSSAREFHRFDPNPTALAFHQGAPDRDYIVLLGSDSESLRAVRHEYMHLLLTHGSATLPLWLEEGTAEMYSTVELTAAGALFGSPIRGHVQALQNLAWIDDDAFFATTKKAPILEKGTYAGMFYAQSWALVHMLNFSPAWRRNLPRFLELIEQGTPAMLAFEPAFGASPHRALEALRIYIKNARFATALVPIPPREQEAPTPAEPLDAGSVGLAHLELLLTLHRQDEAVEMLASIHEPPTPALATARGLVALARKDNREAKAQFLEAMRLGDKTAVPAFEYAMLIREEHAPDGEVRRYLSEAVGRNPDYAEAHFMLGVMAQRENRHRDAIESFQEAIRVLPRQSYFWHALALSHLELKQPELARRAALRAAASAVSASELEMAQAALKLVSEKPKQAASTPPRPTVFVPDSWKPREGSASVEGVLEQIDCFGPSARFQIRPTSSTSVRLWVDKPGEVLLKDASSISFTFACGPQQPRKVIVEYDPQANLPQSATGRVIAIRFF